MKPKLMLCLAALVLCLTACQAQPVEPPATPTPPETATPMAEVTPTPIPTPEPTPAIDLSALEPWQRGYIELLQEDNRRSREEAREKETGFINWEGYYVLYDVDKDGLPELLILSWEMGAFYASLYTCTSETPLLVDGYFYCGRLPEFYSCPGENGILNDAGRADPHGETHWWRKFSLLDGTLAGEELLHELIEWVGEGAYTTTARTPTQAEMLISGAQGLKSNLISFDYTDGTVNLNLQPILDYIPDLAPWQEAYLDILLHPEEYEEFYAVAEHIPSDNADILEWIIEDDEPYYFAISDLNGDEIPELLLGLGIHFYDPRALLNILCWNEETGTVEDLDGPRTYPLMDTFYFYDTGYFGTINGAGGLYTEFWHLEDKDPDHYWYGYERSTTFNADGELVSWEEFPFESSDGEKYTLQEYYKLLGETGVGVLWQELTEETVRQAFSSPAGEEATP